MPYSSNSSLPPAVKKLSAKLQTAFRKAFNAAYKEYGDEKKAFATAWSTVNKMKGKKALDLDPRDGLIDTLGDVEIYRVDGEMVRDSIDESFTDWAHHYTVHEIPIDEIWIDQQATQDPQEQAAIIEEAETHYKLMALGKRYDEALVIANHRAEAVRKKYDSTPLGESNPSNKVELEKIETLDNGWEVWLVDESRVRESLFPNFVEGGNFEAYNFVPEGHIWIGDEVEPQERPYIQIHEVTECELMQGGESYIKAHEEASRKEYEARSNMWESDETNVTRVGAKALGDKDGNMDELRVAKREDVSPKEGKRKYGNVTYADEKNKKYPIDTEEHIRAAWNYINKKKNAGKYSSSDASSIKRKIIAAWKKKISKDGPPSAAGKAVFFLDDTADIFAMPDAEMETVWDSMKADCEMDDLELVRVSTGAPNLRAITDAPKLRAKDSQYCANCNFYKWMPPNMRCDDPMMARAFTDDEVESIVANALPARGICEEPDIQAEVGANWVCDSWEQYNWQDHMPADEADTEDKALTPYRVDTSFVSKLKPIRMVGETRAAGYGVYFAKDKKEKDVVGTRFTKATDLGEFYDKAPVMYHHGLVKAFGLDKIAKTVKAQTDDVGVWLEIELDRSKSYWQKVKSKIEQGIYYFSGGSAEHLIDTAPDGELRAFPIFEWSITTTPAEWRLGASQFYKAIGIDVDSRADGGKDGKGAEEARQKLADQERNARNRSTEQGSMEVDMDEKEIAAMKAEMLDTATKAALAAMKAEQEKAAKEAEERRAAEEKHQAEIKAVAEKAVADYKASLPADATQRPGYGRYNVNLKPLGDGFSFSKAIRGIALSTDNKPNAWSGAEREKEAMQKYANEVRASLAEGVGDLGGYLVPPEYLQDQFIPLLRARAVVRMAGARTYPAKSDIVYIPSQTGGATAAWYGENATLNASNLTFGQLTINIRKLGALEYISNELLADSSPAADQLVKEDLANVIALKEDSTYLMSNGLAPNFANAPIGFAFYPGTSSVTMAIGVSGHLAVADLFSVKLKLMQANVPFDNSMAWFMSPRTWDTIAQFKDAQNRYLLETLTGGNVSQYPAYGAYPEGPETSIKGSVQGRLFGYPVYVTANITDTNTVGGANDCSFLFFARMNDVFIAERAGLELMASNVAGTAFASDQTWVRGIMREGLGIRHAPAVAVVAGID